MSLPKISLFSIESLRPFGKNARIHSKKQIRQIADSISRFGWTYPILVDEHGQILAGHGRFAAAASLGYKEVPVLTLAGLTEAEKRVYVLADNKIAANAGWDRATLAAELGELATLLPQFNLDINITGFDPAEVDGLLGELVDNESEAEDIPPPIAAQPISQRGDVWIFVSIG